MISWFGKKKEMRSEEYEQLFKRIVDLSGEIADIRKRCDLLSTDTANLRGRFNKQLAWLPKEEEKVTPKEEENKPETKPLNTTEPMVFTGMPYGIIPK